MAIASLQLTTPIKPHDNPAPTTIPKPARALVITQIALLALAFIGAIAFVIVTAVTLNAFFLIGGGICTAIALAILGNALCCRSMGSRVFVPRHENPCNEQAFYRGYHQKSPLEQRHIPWPTKTKTCGNRVIARQR